MSHITINQEVFSHNLREAMDLLGLSVNQLREAVNSSEEKRFSKETDRANITNTFLKEARSCRANEASPTFSRRVKAIEHYFKEQHDFNIMEGVNKYVLWRPSIKEALVIAITGWVIAAISLGLSLYAVIGG